MKYLDASATISGCGDYRYDLRRVWDADKAACLFVMLNPSTADGTTDDPTIRRCVGFADRWGFGSLVVVNLFALRATDPRQLYKAGNPVGPDNDDTITRHATAAALAVAAWGAHGKHRDRGLYVKHRFKALGVQLHHLGLTADGQPKHPLYLSNETRPQVWQHRAAEVEPERQGA